MFGNKIKKLRKEKGLTQQEFGDIFGVTKNTISNWENNISKPPYKVIEKIINYFNITAETLFAFNIKDLDKIDRLVNALKENGINDIDTAIKILSSLKEDEKST